MARQKRSENSSRVRVAGTGPLSFELSAGAVLTIREFGPSPIKRPTAGGSRFKSTAYLLFKGQTKIGRLSPTTVSNLAEKIPSSCKVVEVDKAKKILLVDLT
jgi:hypothetical protein